MPSLPKLADPGALIRGGKLKTDEFRVCMDPDLIAEHEDLLEQRVEAKARAQDSFAGGNVADIEEKIADVLQRIEAQTIVLVLKALSRVEFKALKDKHPPRRDAEGNPSTEHAEDWRYGVNVDTFFDPLVRAELVSPVLDEETLTLLIEERLTDGQWDRLAVMAWNLNLKMVDVPFSSAVSRRTRNSSRK